MPHLIDSLFAAATPFLKSSINSETSLSAASASAASDSSASPANSSTSLSNDRLSTASPPENKRLDDESPNAIIDLYESLSPGVFEQDQGELADDDADWDTKPKAKRRKKGKGKSRLYDKRKANRKGNVWVPVSPNSRKRKPQQPKVKKPVAYDATQWLGFDPSNMPERKMREMISLVYLIVMHAPPPEDWKGTGGTITQIRDILKMTIKQHQRIENVIADTHFAYLTGAEYDSAREFRAGTRIIKSGSIEEQMVADLRERGLSYSETTILICRDCITKVVRQSPVLLYALAS